MKNPVDLQASLVFKSEASLGEGAIWHAEEQKLYWVDIEGKKLCVYDPSDGTNKEFNVGSMLGTVVPVQSGGAVIAMQSGIQQIDTKSGELTWLLNALPDTVNVRYNDGKCDPSGRLWVGTFRIDGQKEAAVLWRIDKDTSVHLILDKVGISNGIVWTKDKKKMYYADTPTGLIQAFDYDDQTGNISNRSVAVTIPKESGEPDGMTIDENDNLWVALWGSGTVCQYNSKTGELMQRITVPAPNVTSCAFGGKDLDILYITTAANYLTPEQAKDNPLSGSLFSVKPGVKGVTASYYKQGL